MKTAFINGKIYKKFNPSESCESIVVDDDRVIYIGNENDAIKMADDIVDLKGKTVIPGFIDAHMHLDELGSYLNILDLRNTKSIEELRERLKKFSKSHTGPVMGHGWDQELFEERRWPEKKDIDDIVNDRPVILTRVCLHAALVNSYFLDLMKFKSENGIIKEKDFEIFRQKFNSLIPRDVKKKYILDGIEELIKNGITSIGFVSCNREIFEILKELDYENKIPIRIHVYMDPMDFKYVKDFKNTEHLKLKGIKLFIDGSLGARTALLSEKYNDADTYGEMVSDEEFLSKSINDAFNENFQVAIHAIGDRAMDVAIKLLENKPGNRIEHCSLVRNDQLEKLKNTNLVVQPHFVITDFWILERIGEKRHKLAYRFKDLLKTSNVAFSTDAPVEPINPFQTIYAAISRGKFENVPLSRFTGQEVSIEEALHCYTKGSAIALKEEDLGEIDMGKKADFIVLNKDPIEMDENSIKTLIVKDVYVSGKKLIQMVLFIDD